MRIGVAEDYYADMVCFLTCRFTVGPVLETLLSKFIFDNIEPY